MRMRWLAGSLLLGGMTATMAMAQDTRTVKEPVIPAPCITLHADRTGVAEKLDAKYENNTDTVLIQTGRVKRWNWRQGRTERTHF